MPGLQIGQLLVEQGILTAEQVEHILRVQRAAPRPFGDLAERLYGVSPQAVENAWVEQYVRAAGIVDLEQLEVDTACLRMLNRRQAWQFRLLPVDRDEQTLNIATDAHSLVRAVNFAVRQFSDPVFFMVAERQQLRDFLMRHYPVPEFMASFAETIG